jgi:Zn-dependent metalloprotease
MENKKHIILICSCLLALLVLTNQSDQTKPDSFAGKSKSKISTPMRSIASVKKSDVQIPLKKEPIRKIIGRSDLPFKPINKIDKKWKSKALSNLSKVWIGDKGIDIEHKNSAVFIKNGIAKNVEHVIVSLVHNNGNPSSFEAYIDSQTGKIVKSWNKTRYESRKPLKVDPTPLGFTGLTVKKQ